MTNTIDPSQVSVIILYWNGYDDTRATIQSLLHCTPTAAEIVVCDNGSDINGAALFSKEFGDAIRCVRFPENYGVTGGFNAAISQADRPFVVILDDDTEVTEGWLEALLAAMEDPQVAACQPKFRSLRDPAFFDYNGSSGGYLDRFGYPFTRGRIIHTVEKDRGQYDTLCDIHWTSGACMMFRRALWDKHGPFVHFHEVDLCWRWRNDGYRIVSVPSSVVRHKGAPLRSYAPQRLSTYHRNNLLTILSLSSPLQLITVLLPRLCLEWVTIVYYLCTGHIAAAWAVCRAFFSFLIHVPQTVIHRPRAKRYAPLFPRSIVWAYFIRRRRTFSELLSR